MPCDFSMKKIKLGSIRRDGAYFLFSILSFFDLLVFLLVFVSAICSTFGINV